MTHEPCLRSQLVLVIIRTVRGPTIDIEYLSSFNSSTELSKFQVSYTLPFTVLALLRLAAVWTSDLK